MAKAKMMTRTAPKAKRSAPKRPAAAKKAPARRKSAESTGPVREAMHKVAEAAKTVMANMAARRARRQAAVVNLVAKDSTAAKRMNSRATAKTAAAARQRKARSK